MVAIGGPRESESLRSTVEVGFGQDGQHRGHGVLVLHVKDAQRAFGLCDSEKGALGVIGEVTKCGLEPLDDDGVCGIVDVRDANVNALTAARDLQTVGSESSGLGNVLKEG